MLGTFLGRALDVPWPCLEYTPDVSGCSQTVSNVLIRALQVFELLRRRFMAVFIRSSAALAASQLFFRVLLAVS